MRSFLQEERKRLGYDQSHVFDSVCVSKATYARWEAGSPVPSDKLSMLAKMGFDTQYIITGVKNDLALVSNGGLGENEITLGFKHAWLEQRGVAVNRVMLFVVKGDAMSPTFNSGDVLLVEAYIHQEKTSNDVQIKQGLAVDEVLEHDGIYLVRLDGRQTIRKIQLMPDGARVFSDNPLFQELHVKAADINAVVLGKVVWCAKDVD